MDVDEFVDTRASKLNRFNKEGRLCSKRINQKRQKSTRFLDESCGVQYWKGNDTLRFSSIGAEKDGRFRVVGAVSDIKLNVGKDRPAWFVLDSANEVFYRKPILGTPPNRLGPREISHERNDEILAMHLPDVP